MAYEIRYSNVSSSNALRKGDFEIGVNSVGYGPTSVTGFYKGTAIPDGGYAIYLNKPSGGPAVYAVSNDSELINITREASGTTYSTAQECLQYFVGQDDKMVISSNDNIPNLVTSGLYLHTNTQNVSSYPTTGSSLYNLSNFHTSSVGTLYNGVTYTENSFKFDGAGDYVRFVDAPLPLNTNSFTIDVLFLPSSSIVPGEEYRKRGNLFEQGNPQGSYSYGSKASLYVWDNNRLGMIGIFSDAYSAYNIYEHYKWNRCSVTVDNSLSSWKVKFYKNGKYNSSGNMNGVNGINVRTGYAGLGSDRGVGTFFNGNIAEVNVYNRVLSETELTQLYHQAPIVTDGLIFATDAGNLMSHVSSSSVLTSLTGSITGSLLNGTKFEKSYGGGYRFDGTNDWIQLQPDNLPTGNVPKTMEVWLTCGTTSTAFKFAFAMGSANNSQAIFIGRTYSTLLFGGYGNDLSVSGFFSDKINVPVHLVLTYGGGVARGYYNGEQIVSGNKNWSMGSSVFRIGRQVNNFLEYWTGKVFVGRVYDRVLSPEEIQQNFNAQRKRFGI